MAARKGRNVSAAEKPVYEQCTRLFLDGEIHAFWAYEKNEWAIQRDADHPPTTMTLGETKAVLLTVDPDGCTWDKPTTRTGKAALLALSRRLLDALTTGDCDERLIIEANNLIGAA